MNDQKTADIVKRIEHAFDEFVEMQRTDEELQVYGDRRDYAATRRHLHHAEIVAAGACDVVLAGLGTSLDHLASEQRIALGQQAAYAAAIQVGLDQLCGQRGVLGELRRRCPDREQLINAINAQSRALDLKHHINGDTEALQMLVHAVDGDACLRKRGVQIVERLRTRVAARRSQHQIVRQR